MTPSFTFPLPVKCDGGRRPGSLADAPQDWSSSEALSPRTVLTENICRCIEQILQNLPTTMPFLTASTITFSCLASASSQADSWWLGHVVPDVVFADTGGQALDIFLHGLESAHKNGIVKTFTHTFAVVFNISQQQHPLSNKLRNCLLPCLSFLFSSLVLCLLFYFVDVFSKYSNIYPQQCPF